MSNVRLIAARLLDQVTDGHSLAACFDRGVAKLQDAKERAFVQALVYGACRYYSRLDIILSLLLKKPMRAKESDVHALLIIGLYQLIFMRIPAYAAVQETVHAAKQLKKSWARGLVNAILREYMREQVQIEAKINALDEAVYAHPQWWIDAIKKDWPDAWRAILTANNQQAPLSLRVNQKYCDREHYLEQLKISGQSAIPIVYTGHGIQLETACSVERLPGFASGEVSVQDGAAQLAINCLSLARGLRVLDACAAPGGKLSHILEERADLAAVIAVEKDPERMMLIKENLTRLHLHAMCVCEDVSRIKQWWDGQLFERILLDAPCSASGVIRRHPDIKLCRQAADIRALAAEQLHLLNALWQVLAADGILVYATCSIFRDENVGVLKQFFATHQDAQEIKIKADWGLACEFGRQILPGMHDMDGFYYACLQKKARAPHLISGAIEKNI
jgi:16S rRNA (cytosine967-C5)-methyltransferase